MDLFSYGLNSYPVGTSSSTDLYLKWVDLAGANANALETSGNVVAFFFGKDGATPETFTTNAGTDDAKEYSYEDGQFHLKQSPNDENTVWKKNFLDANLVIAPLTNGYADNTDLVVEGNQFFTENCVDAPAAASSETLTNYEADMVTDKTTWMNQAVVGDITPEQAVQNYIDKYGDASAAILEELNAQ
jgi:multiple sugar transport system substrate-binding protein/putative aldouronate transport system substrate-binding protein